MCLSWKHAILLTKGFSFYLELFHNLDCHIKSTQIILFLFQPTTMMFAKAALSLVALAATGVIADVSDTPALQWIR